MLFWTPGTVLCVEYYTTTSHGNMYSVNYPDSYGDSVYCIVTYRFDTALFPSDIRKWVILDFQSFSMPDPNDYLMVFYGHSTYYYTGNVDGTIRCK